MQVEVRREDPGAVVADALIVPLAKSDTLPRALASLDRALGGRIGEYLAAGGFESNDEMRKKQIEWKLFVVLVPLHHVAVRLGFHSNIGPKDLLRGLKVQDIRLTSQLT